MLMLPLSMAWKAKTRIFFLFIIFYFTERICFNIWVTQVATISQFFISYTIRTFGALTFATIMTTRQVTYTEKSNFYRPYKYAIFKVCNFLLKLLQLVSIILSCVWFSHPLSGEQYIGSVSLFPFLNIIMNWAMLHMHTKITLFFLSLLAFVLLLKLNLVDWSKL